MNNTLQKDFDNLEKELRCAICLEIWKDPCTPPCGHIFCKECLELALKSKRLCPLCKIPILRRSSVLSLQSLDNLIEQFHVLMKKFEKNEPEPPSPLKQFFKENIDDSILEEKLYEIELSQNGITEHLKKINKEIEENGILSLMEEDYKFLNEIISKENVNFENEEFQKPEEENEKFELDISEEEEEEINKENKETPKKETLIKETKESNKKRKREIEFYPSEYKPEEMVIIGTVLSAEQTKLIKSSVKKLGGKFVTKYNEKVTHVITTVDHDNIARRTLKYSSGIVRGNWIVGFQWITDSFKKNQWLKEDDYEVLGDNVALNGPRKGREEDLYLFKDVHIYFNGTFESPNPSLNELILLLKYGGGNQLKSLPTKSFLKNHENVFIIVDGERQKNEIDTLKKKTGLNPISFTWLLDSTSHYEIQPIEDYSINV
eukprot:gene1147-10661_t